MTREVLALQVDGATLAAIDKLARAKGIDRHAACRALMALGLELLRARKQDEQLALLGRSS